MLPRADVARADGPATRPTGSDALTTAIRVATVRPDRLEQNFRTTVRLRPGQPMIVGGMTGEPGVAGDRKALCLVLTAFAEDGTAASTRPAGVAP